jgi:hypothetical protein
MSSITLSRWRSISGLAGCVSALMLSVCAVFIYERYFAPIQSLPWRVAEMQHHASALSILWRLCFFGSLLTLIASAFGRSWPRIAGICLSSLAFLFSIMTLGAACGPFGC